MRETGRSGCPINLAVEVLGDRWSLLILRDMIFAGKRSYNQLLDSDERIATNILRDRLNFLVGSGLLTKLPDPDQPRRKIYGLTARSIALVPLLVHLGSWGQQWLPASPNLRRKAKELFAGGPVLWDEIMAGLREAQPSRSEVRQSEKNTRAVSIMKVTQPPVLGENSIPRKK